jgi:hypothetical protein
MNAPFNLALHDHLIELGYTYERMEEYWEDVGGPESGPDLVGWPTTDVYTTGADRFYVSESGTIEHAYRDKDAEEAAEAMERALEETHRKS